MLDNDAPLYTVLESPAGVDPFSWAIFAVAAVLAVTAVVLMPKPAMPSNVNRTQSSANNSLTDRNNQLRLLQRVEDIYGTVRSIPSLMMPTYNKYRNNKLYEYGYYCISRGYIEATDIRDAETLISDIDGASAAVYHPFTSPGHGAPVIQIGEPIQDGIIQARRAEEIDGVTLKAPNQVQLPSLAHYNFLPDPDGDRIVQVRKEPNFDAVAEAGDQVSVSMTTDVQSLSGDATAIAADSRFAMVGIGSICVVGWTLEMSGFTNATNNLPRAIVSFTQDEVTVSGPPLVDEAGVAATATTSGPDLSGTYTIAGVGDGFVRLETAEWPAAVENKLSSVQLIGATEWTGWVTVPDLDRSQLWSNVIAAQGMYKDGGGGRARTSVRFELQAEKLDEDLRPTGITDTVPGTISGNSTQESAVTLERITPWKGPVRVRMRRTTPYDFGFNGTVIDEIKWQDLYAITPVDRAHFGNKTTIHTVTKATERATSLRNRQINCLASRLLPTYNGKEFSGRLDSDGRLISGTVHRTSQITDIIAAVSVDPKIGARTLSEDVDIDQIYMVNQRVNALHSEAGQFNFTFDSDEMSYEETLSTIANAAFCIAYRQNNVVRLSFDGKQASSSALFTHRNKRPKSDSITRKFASDSEYDGVEFVYQDPETETSETITLPREGGYTKLKKFEIPGIRSFAQAWLRANREYYKLIGQRLTLRTDATGEARGLLPNARIDVVDNTRYEAYDGEVVGQAGLELTLSREVAFTDGEPHSIVLIKRDGSLDSIPVRPGSDNNRVILARAPMEPIVTEYGPDGVRTIFSFAADSARGAMAWMVQELDQSDPNYVAITAINYSDSYYQMDGLPIPPKESIIN
ncbi:host specificity factor TipJ family phage tail protein [Cupriavidus gilardii]|uniref:host specificity factor TipJ family phage tail protein n=1 Tax=Cupriavidus gilardii TaxID=82541 RepID=UPI0021B3B295|nr:host specificity factor TipJ family phage tail protein [Cupriavidus gilardii]UXC37359.1 host specificity factor TipJ family phage tail protein [Cupriavidus gilardii]